MARSEHFYGSRHPFGKLLSPKSHTNLYDQVTATKFSPKRTKPFSGVRNKENAFLPGNNK